MKKRSFFDKLIFVITLILSILLLLACLVPYTNSATLAFLSLAVPLLVILDIILLIYWILKRRWIIIIPMIALFIGYFSLGSFVQFRSEENTKDQNQLKIMTYNASGFQDYSNHHASREVPQKIANFITSENPDIISFQEFSYRINRTVMKSFYPHQYVIGYSEQTQHLVTQAIYSKYPIIDKGELNFPQSANHGIYADIVIELDTIRVYNLHLESLKIRPGMVKRERSDRLFKRLRNSFAKQYEQALIFRKNADESPYTKIVCGDLNNTQFSSPYRIIKGDMSDSFAEKGSGYGKTINFWRFPLRIDFILADPKFEVLSHQNYNLQLSDHEPIMASFDLSPTNK